MSDRPTPETDAMAVTCYGESGIENSFGFLAVPIKDCRKLERERDEAREAADKWRKLHDIKDELFKKGIAEVERERDEAREEINIIGNTLSQNGEAVGNGEHDFSIIEIIKNLIQSRGYFRRKSDSLERERDEARDEAAMWKWHWMAARKEVENLIKEETK